MARLERSARCIFVLLVLFSAPLGAQEAPRADLAGWFQDAWARLAAPFTVLWSDGRGACDPNGKPCGGAQSSEPLPAGRGACDPDGGGCDPTS